MNCPLFDLWSPVPHLEDKSHFEMGGCVARAGLFGPYGLLHCQGGEWPFPEVLTFCMRLFYILALLLHTHWYFISDFEYDVFITARYGNRHTQFYHPSEKRCLTEDQPGLFAILVNERNNSSKNENTVVVYLFFMVYQELAGYTGGDVRFLKEDFEIQLNKTLFWDSVRCYKKLLLMSVCCHVNLASLIYYSTYLVIFIIYSIQ